MHHIETVVSYWNAARSEARLPAKADISPGELFGSLSHMFIAEDRDGQPNLRVAGSMLNQAFGLDLTSVPLLGMWDRKDGLKVLSMLRDARTRAEPLVVESAYLSVRKRTGTIRMVLLPFIESEGSIGTLGAVEIAPSLPEGLDRIATVRLTTERRVRKSSANPDPLREQLGQLARRRGDGRADPKAARDLREAGGRPLQPVR